MDNDHTTTSSPELKSALDKDICYYTDNNKLVVNIQLNKEVLYGNSFKEPFKLVLSNNNYAIVHPNQSDIYRNGAIIVVEYNPGF